MRKLSIIAGALVAAVVVAVPALGITGGQVDGTAHPSVGLVVDAAHTPLCSGVLVSPTVVVTAGHCFAQSNVRVAVSFDPVVDLGTARFSDGRAIVDPLYGTDKKDSHDLAVVVLDSPVVGIAPSRLPAAGFDSGLAAGSPVTNVGYGYDTAKSPVFDGTRRFSTSLLAKVDATTLDLKLRTGGVCFGDSGGPHFVGDVVAAIVSSGNKVCTGQSTGYRLDTPSARAFLAPYMS